MTLTKTILPLCWCFSVATLAAEDLSPKRGMTPVDFLSIPGLSGAAIAPDGDAVAYVRRDTNWDENRYDKTLWLRQRGSDAGVQLTHERKDVSSPQFSPDGARLAFLADPPKGKEDELYLLPLGAAGEAKRLTHHGNAVKSPRWSLDGEWIYFLSRDEDPSDDDDAELRNLIRPFDTPLSNHLWRVRVADGETERLTKGDYHVRGYALTADGKIVLQCADSALIDSRHQSTTVRLARPDGSDQHVISAENHEQLQPRLSPGGLRLMYLADVNEAGEPYYQTNLFVADVGANSASRLILPNSDYEFLSAEWGPDDETIYLTANLGVHSQLFRLDLDPGDPNGPGQLTALTEGRHDILAWRLSANGKRVMLQLASPTSPGDLWVLNIDPVTHPEQVTHVYDRLFDEFLLPDQNVIRWTAHDGQLVEALLTTPLKDSGAPAPLVVQSHGGPRSSDRYGVWKWKNYQPVLATLGYATLRVNYRGSTGYGERFHRDMVGDYFRSSHLDVLGGVDHVVESGVADPEALVTMGWSAGGHMTNKLITVTGRFKAASSGAGAVDWVSMYGQSDTRFNRTPWFGAPPWSPDTRHEAYLEQSPLKDMWRATTPTLIFTGNDDERVPPTQSILLSRALTDNRIPNKLYVAPGQGHDWGTPKLRLFKINRELEWFEKYACDREYLWDDPASLPQ